MISEIHNVSGACHVYTDASMMTTEKDRPVPDHRILVSDF